MIMVRTPFRISFFGGGTDYPAWYREHPGSVLSTTIDKYCYITCRHLPPFFDYRFRIRYYQKEEVKNVSQIRHPSVRECLRYMSVDDGVEVVHNADLPARSGLGSSSAFTVCMLHALHTLKSMIPTKRELALKAIHVEQELIRENVGSQDQTAVAFGGLNRIDFGGSNVIRVTPIVMQRDRMEELQQNLLILFTGLARDASDVARTQVLKTRKKEIDLFDMLDLVDEAYGVLTSKTRNLDDFGTLLHEQWRIKKTLTSAITNGHINDIYKAGLKAGALGGKLLGAGGGGFILFYARPEHHATIKKKLSKLLHVPFYFEHLGSQVIYYTHQ